MLFRGDFGAIMHIDIHPPLYVTRQLGDDSLGSRSQLLMTSRPETDRDGCTLVICSWWLATWDLEYTIDREFDG
jgi:hypothetical protein